MGPSGVQFVPLAKFNQADILLNLLRGGQVLRGRVVSGEHQPALLVGGQRIPLPADLSVSPGQSLTVRLFERNGKQTLDIRPGGSAEAAGHAHAKTIQPMLQRVLDILGVPTRADQAAAIAPKAVPLRQADLESIVRLFVQRAQTGTQLARVAAALEQAAAAGTLRPEVFAGIRVFTRQARLETADDFQALLRVARDSLGRPLEQRLAALVARAASAPALSSRDSLVAELMRLRQDAAVRTALEQSGQGRAFTEAADALLERFQAARLQNARALEFPYQFIDVPMPPESGVDHAQIHFVGDEPGPAGERKRAHLVVLDLQLSRLGALWVAVQSRGADCHCVFRVDNDAARDALAAAEAELREAIAGAGYASVRIHTEAWDGDRLTAVAELMGRLSGFEVQA